MNKTIAIGSDHAGYELKEYIKEHLKEAGYEVEDYGTNSADRCDYADYAHPVAVKVGSSAGNRGVLICGSANGISMAANKHPNVRAAICWNKEITELARLHNDANIISLPARFIAKELAWECVDTFLNTPFEGGRHEARVKKINL